MNKKKINKARLISFVLSLALLVGLMPTTVFASAENGSNFATATSRDYNGTDIVDVTDMVFAKALVGDDVSADAIGTLSSADAGNYTTVNLTEIVPKGADIGYYEFPTELDNIPTDVTISKIDPIINLEVVPSENTYGGQQLVVTATITNDFNNDNGLPTADEVSLSVKNATLKSGTSVVKNGNAYSATFITDTNKIGQNVTVSANVAETAKNYNKLGTAITKTIPIIKNNHELWVNGVDISIAENNTVVCGEGSAVYDKATATLTLTNATITTDYFGKGIAKDGDVSSDNILNIVFVGENSITTNEINEIYMGISTMGQINISGNGSLDITTSTTSKSYITNGIYAWSGLSVTDATLTMNDTTPTLTDCKGSGIDINEFSSVFSATNANIKVDGYEMGLNVPSGDITVDGSKITVINANRGISGGNEIDNFKIINSTVNATVTGENALGLLNGHEITIDNSIVNLSSDSSNAIYTDGAITIKNGSNLDVNGFYPALFSTLDTTITDSTVKAVSTDDSAIFSKDNIIVNGNSNVTAKGKWAGINAVGDIIINNGKVNAASTNDMGIWAKKSLAINGGEVYAKGAEGFAAMGVRYEKQSSDTDPVAQITVNSNYADINGGKISVSDWFNGTTADGNLYTRSWTSFIAKDDANKLLSDRSNALNEVTIIIKGADYSKVDEQIAKANALNKDNYKDFSAVETAINAVVRDKDITEQEAVNAMAKAIEDAIKALTLKGADYSKVDEQIAKANALNKDNYKDFSAVETAINAVVRGKDITEQDAVNTMAKAIEDAITDLELKPVTPSAAAPEIIEGANQSVEQGKSARFKSNADIKDFQKVLLDGKEIHSSYYTVTEGSTIVTLKEDFIKTLSVGKHTLSIVSTTGSADTEFTITMSTTFNPDTNGPQTGDDSNMVLWVALLFISAGVVLTLILKRKKSVK